MDNGSTTEVISPIETATNNANHIGEKIKLQLQTRQNQHGKENIAEMLCLDMDGTTYRKVDGTKIGDNAQSMQLLKDNNIPWGINTARPEASFKQSELDALKLGTPDYIVGGVGEVITYPVFNEKGEVTSWKQDLAWDAKVSSALIGFNSKWAEQTPINNGSKPILTPEQQDQLKMAMIQEQLKSLQEGGDRIDTIRKLQEVKNKFYSDLGKNPAHPEPEDLKTKYGHIVSEGFNTEAMQIQLSQALSSYEGVADNVYIDKNSSSVGGFVTIELKGCPMNKMKEVLQKVHTVYPRGIRVNYSENLDAPNTMEEYNGWVQICPAGIDKGTALEYLMEQARKDGEIPKDTELQTHMVGDGIVDIPALLRGPDEDSNGGKNSIKGHILGNATSLTSAKAERVQKAFNIDEQLPPTPRAQFESTPGMASDGVLEVVQSITKK